MIWRITAWISACTSLSVFGAGWALWERRRRTDVSDPSDPLLPRDRAKAVDVRDLLFGGLHL